jgi:hypothetical protein
VRLTSAQLVLDVPVQCLRFQVGTSLRVLRNPDHWYGLSLLTPKTIGPGSEKGLRKMNSLTPEGLEVVTDLIVHITVPITVLINVLNVLITVFINAVEKHSLCGQNMI